MAKLIKEILVGIRCLFDGQQRSLSLPHPSLGDVHYLDAKEDKKNMQRDFAMFAGDFRNAVNDCRKMMSKKM